MKKLISYGKDIINEFQKDNVPLLGAAQAYYYLLSIVPLLILVLSILPYLNIDAETAIQAMSNVIPSDTAEVFRENMVAVVERPNGGLLTLGILGTLWSASNGINAFIQSSNMAYNVEETRSFIQVRLLSIGLTIGMIIAILVALLLPVFGQVIIDMINLPGQTAVLLQVLRWSLSVVVIGGVLMALYHFAPNKNIPFKHILPGAILTAVLWQLISLAFSFYVSNFGSYTATYGSLGGIIILMLWFFLTGIILMVGAEINVVYHRRHGSGASKAA
ncbi:membrane protein [Halobacillus karajensis]|uniref:YihY family inner membrane protein n=1 Tax=Halobacillus karajensis TaxID=195088 RepID=A0A059NX64_9BACI|nr:YihY/virulence factor BrkB family protein [Halobacillus karajensis]CDQ18578.1 ribonuclease BN/unknown domain fusion protein [Halobacillus karajensis]CDQ23350.1 ribonuclease BN/unknown domain fusion protein [Halobacillus karajensis]CDQ26832.1 ribonuclease BN/unknown domain fusion protein [Halobacillus karajensis]SEH49652.1 membrane protein [Halobacillus karajensis]